MSSIRIALVAEGPTDLVIIDAALKAIIGGKFVLTQLQPEYTNPRMGSGWTGVLKWCVESSQRHHASLDTDPTLEFFDLLVIHLDVDVSTESYLNAGEFIRNWAEEKGWEQLPCAQPCPEVIDSVVPLIATLDSWLSPAARGQKTVLCLPGQASGTWLAAAILPADHALLENLECNREVENGLSGLPLAIRVRKNRREYQSKANLVTEKWHVVKMLCSCATAFEDAIRGAIQ